LLHRPLPRTIQVRGNGWFACQRAATGTKCDVSANRVNRRGDLRVSPYEARRKRDAEPRFMPGSGDACTITGEADALVHIRAADVRHFEDVMERIRAEPFVVRTRSVIVLSRLVDRDPMTDVLAPLR
jgi:DNA-binding Lrp family transcriptional regulator